MLGGIGDQHEQANELDNSVLAANELGMSQPGVWRIGSERPLGDGFNSEVTRVFIEPKAVVVEVEAQGGFMTGDIANPQQALSADVEMQARLFELPALRDCKPVAREDVNSCNAGPRRAARDRLSVKGPVLDWNGLANAPRCDFVATAAEPREALGDGKERMHGGTLARAARESSLGRPLAGRDAL